MIKIDKSDIADLIDPLLTNSMVGEFGITSAQLRKVGNALNTMYKGKGEHGEKVRPQIRQAIDNYLSDRGWVPQTQFGKTIYIPIQDPMNHLGGSSY
jgi:hypothetical protein